MWAYRGCCNFVVGVTKYSSELFNQLGADLGAIFREKLGAIFREHFGAIFREVLELQKMQMVTKYSSKIEI